MFLDAQPVWQVARIRVSWGDGLMGKLFPSITIDNGGVSPDSGYSLRFTYTCKDACCVEKGRGFMSASEDCNQGIL